MYDDEEEAEGRGKVFSGGDQNSTVCNNDDDDVEEDDADEASRLAFSDMMTCC